MLFDVNGKNLYGDLNESSIQEIWKNQDFQNLRKNLINNDRENLPELCKDCTYPKKGQWSLPFLGEKFVNY